MTTLEALDLPECHMRVALGTCAECGKDRPYGIPADQPLVKDEYSIDVVSFLEAVLRHCEEGHFKLTSMEIEARRAAQSAGAGRVN